MSGARDDGTAGLRAVKEAGGIAVVQDPTEALASSMPLSAIEHVQVDAIRPTDEIAALLVRLATIEPGLRPSGDGAGGTGNAADAADAREPEAMRSTSLMTPGNSSGLTCPECSGALWEVKEHNLVQYRCRVGHVYSLESMLAEQSRAVEAALWAGAAALEERAELMRRIADRAGGGQFSRMSEQFNDEAEHAEHQAPAVARRRDGVRSQGRVRPEWSGRAG